MNYDKLTETLRQHGVSCVRAHGRYCSICDEAATALSTLQAENEKLRAELEQVKQDRDALIDDFVDYVTGGVPNPAIFCKNRCDKCTDMRGWCTGKDCKGFYPSGASGQKED